MSNFNFYGLTSGIDTGSLISSMMQLKQINVDKLVQQKTQLTKQKDSFSSVQTKLTDLVSKIDSSSFNVFKTTTNSDLVNVKTSSNVTEGNYNFEVLQLAQKEKIGSIEVDPNVTMGELGVVPSKIKINGSEIEIAESDTLMDLQRKIMTANPPATSSQIMKMPNGNYRLIMSSQVGGSNGIEIENMEGNAAEILGFLNSDNSKNTLVEGKDAIVKFDGIEFTLSENEFEPYDGLNIQFKNVGQTEISVEKDTETINKNVKTFVDEFNALNSFIKSQTNFSVDSDYNVTKGNLYGDSIIKSIQNNLMKLVQDNNLWEIGITTDWKTGGLKIDEEVFNKAMKENPSLVEEKLTKFSSEMENSVKALDEVFTEKNNTFDKKQRDLDDRIAFLERSNEIYREQLIKQFTAMETIMAQMQQQQQAMMAQLGMLQ